MIDIKSTARRHRRAIAVVAAAALLVPVAALSAVGQDQAAVVLQQRQELLAQSVVTDVSEAEQVVRVDVARDPEAADAWLDESADLLDGWTVVVAGTDAPSGEDRAQGDAEAMAGDPPSGAGACPEVPGGPRSPEGATTPYLGCGPATSVQATGAQQRSGGQQSLDEQQATGAQQATTGQTITQGPPRATLARAVDEVLAAYLPGADLAPTTVHLDHGAATVDVAPGFEEAMSDAGVYPGDVWQALLFTAHSNGALDSVTFTVDGDCLAFAYATGGDMCAPTDLPIELG
ncbi:hypothetical protein [Promicromonospora sp. NPDC050880]|uniref:hypothetical protein n=1 Tax=Promicromonospora sp. NPDC050880 TaxID=3364406 RepID=UPI00378A2386